jgi:hypothetical protein
MTMVERETSGMTKQLMPTERNCSANVKEGKNQVQQSMVNSGFFIRGFQLFAL